MAAPTINFAGFVYDDSGDAVSGATIHIYDKNSTTTAREASSVTTNSSGYYSYSHATAGEFDTEIVKGTSKRRYKFDDKIHLSEIDVEKLSIRGNNTVLAGLYLYADQGADVKDQWLINARDGGELGIGNDAASQGTFVDQITLTPHATIASSSVKIPGILDVNGSVDWDVTDVQVDSSGDIDLVSSSNTAAAIYLHQSTGTSGTIKIHADTGTSVTEGAESVNILSDVGGVGIRSTANLAKAVNITSDGGTTGSIAIFNDQGTSVTEGAESISLLSDAGGVGIRSTANLANAVNITVDGGTTSTMTLFNDQGTSVTEGAESIALLSDAGGVGIRSTANLAKAVNITSDGGTTGSIAIFNDQGTSVTEGAESISLLSDAGGIGIRSTADLANAVNVTVDGGTSSTITLFNDQGTTATEGAASIQLLSDVGGINVKSGLNGANAILLTADGGTSETIVIHADQGTGAGSISAVSDAGGITLDAGLDIVLSADGGNVTMDDGTLTIFDFDVDGTTLTIHDDQDTGDKAVITMAQHGALSIVTTDDDAAAANIQITADGTAELAGTTVTLDSAADIELEATDDINIPSTVGLTFADDGQKIESDGTDFTIASGADLNLTTTGDIVLNVSGASQLYNITDRGDTLAIMSQTDDTQSGIELFSKKGDGGDNVQFEAYGKGTPASFSNREMLQMGYLASGTKFYLNHGAVGTGTVRDFEIQEDGTAWLTKNATGTVDITADVNIFGTTPTLKIGDGGAENTKIVFDGTAVDYYIGLDDDLGGGVGDALRIGEGSTVGTTPYISIFADGKYAYLAALAGTGTSSGASDYAAGWVFFPDITSHSGDSAFVTSIGMGSAFGGSSVLNTGGNTAVAATLYLSEPGIATSHTIDDAASLYIKDAPTEGTRDYALFVDAGTSRFDGNVGIGSTAPDSPLHINVADENLPLVKLEADMGSTNNALSFEIDGTERIDLDSGGVTNFYGTVHMRNNSIIDVGNATSEWTDGNLVLAQSSNDSTSHFRLIGDGESASDVFAQISAQNLHHGTGTYGGEAYIQFKHAGQQHSDRDGVDIFFYVADTVGNLYHPLTLESPATEALTATRAVAWGKLAVGAANDNNAFSTLSVGSGSTTMYLGNATVTTSSDERLKTDIRPTQTNALDLVNKFNVVDFEWDDPTDSSAEYNKNYRGTYTGMVAQETVKVAPWIINDQGGGRDCDECVSGNECEEHGMWHVEYQHLVPTLVKAIQELSKELQEVRNG